MGAPSQRAVRRPGGAADRARANPRTAGSDDAQDLPGPGAGNAALTEALQGRRRRAVRARDRRDEVAAERAFAQQQAGPAATTPASLRVQRPSIDIGLDGAPFRRLARMRGPSNARSVAAALSGRKGTTAARIGAGVRSQAADPLAGFTIDRHTATVRGHLDNFRAVRLVPTNGPMTTGRRLPLSAFGAAMTTVHDAGLRVRVDQVDLMRGRTGATVRTDGAGHLELSFAFNDGSLRMIATDRPGSVEELDWTYILALDLEPFGAVVWRTMPRKRRFTVALYASGAASPPGDDDGTTPRREEQAKAPGEIGGHDLRQRDEVGMQHEHPTNQTSEGTATGEARPERASTSHAERRRTDQREGSQRTDERGPGEQQVAAPRTADLATTAAPALAGDRGGPTTGQDTAAEVVNAARAYLEEVDATGNQDPVTAEGLHALRASVAAHDRQAADDPSPDTRRPQDETTHDS